MSGEAQAKRIDLANPTVRAIVLFSAMFVLILAVGFVQGAANSGLLLTQALAYALIALGLNIQWGYGGLFNFAVMGFMMVGGASVVFVSFPVNALFWDSEGPVMLGRALLAFLAGVLLVWGARHSHRLGVRGGWKTALLVLAWFIAYVVYRSQIDPAAAYIESTAGFVGGLGLNPILGWLFGGLVAAVIAYIVGRISLGLRTDYLAIATIGISEIIRALLKNMDWLTRGTMTASPMPWPVNLPQDYQAQGIPISESFVYARFGFFALLLAIFIVVFFFVQRAYGGPWGRMMRAIRDNHIAAGSMGKNVTGRQLELFVFGSVLIGMGGAILVTFNQIFDPAGYQPINHTFMIWVMVIVGGAGNNWGVLLGAVLIYIVWIISDPLAQAIFLNLSSWSQSLGWGAIPEIDSRALQMRVFVLGIIITVALRYAPRGLLPEVVKREV
ncbi:branched-chain amino acid ABC transporter permease [Devosia limi DSM 17137]|uniref:Branched-chain amino acid ABC transporter permease n=1 Tax=Devosia limi DSM 17137 TaxID=1121477 RepID=A0A0F5LUF4_9HYPH|nr:branched-chain amino acid ABC transporter permease [Devosia limi]KKB85282.1 branched-chain amino acid ABC transporter permease [Devosia limi DSM 17137]SHF88349.1 branched-chain amino acid transport system permease protein [Devosia limi DSM 17137]